MKRFLTLYFLLLILSCNNNDNSELTWEYLQGPWLYEIDSVKYIDYFERIYDNPDDPNNNHGYIYQFELNDSTDTSTMYSHLNNYFYLDQDLQKMVFSIGMVSKTYVDVNILNNTEMTIEYTNDVRLPALGTKVHYYRADNLTLFKDNWPYFIVKNE